MQDQHVMEFLELFRELLETQRAAGIPQWLVALIGAVVGAGLSVGLSALRDRLKRRNELARLRETLYQEITDVFARVVAMFETLHQDSHDPDESYATEETWEKRTDWLGNILDVTVYPYARKDPVTFYQLSDAKTIEILHKNFRRALEEDPEEREYFISLLSVGITVFETEFLRARLDQNLVMSKANPPMKARLKRLLSGEKKSTVDILDRFIRNQEGLPTDVQTLRDS